MRSFSKRGRWSSLGVSTLALAALSVACSDSGESGDFAENSGGGDKPPSAPSNAAGDAPSQGLHSIPEGRADDPVRFNPGPPLDVHLRSRTWTPQPGVDAATKVELGRARDAGKSYLRVYAQRASIPTLDEWSKIEKKNVGVESYLGELTWILRLPVEGTSDATLTQAARDFGSVALSPVLSSDKIDADMLAGKYPKWAFNALENRLDLSVLLFSEVSPSEREEFFVTANLSGVVPQEEAENSFRIQIDPANLGTLLELGAVRFVEPANPPPQLLMAGGLAATGADHVQGLVDATGPAQYSGYTGRGIRMSNGGEGIDKTHDDFWNHDASGVRTTPRFTSSYCDGDAHGTMTAGLMLGNGFRSTNFVGSAYQYRGMAPEASFVCQQDAQDLSSHSYFYAPGGGYTGYEASIDAAVRGGSSVKAFNPSIGAVANQGIHSSGWAQSGYYSVFRPAKNEITVGSVAAPDMRWLQTSIGPTFDGRLKPDLVAPAGATAMPEHIGDFIVDVDSVVIERGTPLYAYSFDATPNYAEGWGAADWWDRVNVGNFQQFVQGATSAFRFTINPLPWGWAWAGYPMVGTTKAPGGVANLNFTGASSDVVKVRYRTSNVPEWMGSVLNFSWSDKPGNDDRYYAVFNQTALLESDGAWHTVTYPVGSDPNWNGRANIQWIRLNFGGPRLPTPGPSNGYQAASGSSAAAPVVAGGVGLLMEQFTDRHGVVMGTHTSSPVALGGAGTGVPLASTFKAILVHTARDLVSVPRPDWNNPDTGVLTFYHKGPDLVTGYGALDIAEAVRLVDADADARAASQAPYLLENTLTTAAGDHFTINVAPGQKSPLKVTVAWDDAPADPLTSEIVPKLVNNVDLLLKGPDGLYYLPYSLDQPYNPSLADKPSLPAAEPITAASIRPARRDLPNNRDNVEQVFVENPLPGTWHVFVLPGGLALPPQKYSLVLGTPPKAGALNQGKVVFLSDRGAGRQIFVKDWSVVGGPVPLTSDSSEKGIPKISPNGRFVVATSGVNLRIYDIANGSVVATFTPATYGLNGFRYPSWSPDGTKIVVDGNVNGTTNSLRVLEFPHAHGFTSPTMRTLIPAGTALNPYETEFSIDGKEIIIVADEAGVLERLFRMPITGGQPRRFYSDGVQPRHSDWPSISPDGRTMIVNSRMYKDDPVAYPQGEEIVEYGYHSGATRRVTADAFDQTFATYAKNGGGEFVMEVRDASNKGQLYVQNDASRILLDVGDPANTYDDMAPDWWKPPLNLARSSLPTASSTFGGYSVFNVVDGSRSTAVSGTASWTNVSGVLPQWVQLDFGANRSFSKVELFTSLGYELRDYDLEYFNGSTWQPLAVVTGNTLTRRTHTFTAVTSRYLRVTCRLGPTGQPTYTRINELEVY